MKEGSRFTARAETLECPYCGFENEGLLGDPRGKEATCDECGERFTVSIDAEAVIQ